MMRGEQLSLLEEARASGEDFEWYPTTGAMLDAVARDLRGEFEERGEARTFSILDIGAGDGNALEVLCRLTRNDGQRYAMEKARALVDALPRDVFVIGTDFHEQTLIDKRVDVIFCNPPYSEFLLWARRIVAEANCRVVYLVVPRRWKEDGALAEVIRRRCSLRDVDEEEDRSYRRFRGKCEVLASMSFQGSEYRESRAEVDVLKLRFDTDGDRPSTDPFDLWFEENFKIDADAGKEDKHASEERRRAEIRDLARGRNLIERLEELYREDLRKLIAIYKALETFNHNLFHELDIQISQVKETLRTKIAGLKNLYWQELFNNLSSITDRLSFASRERLLKKLTEHTSVDFSAANAYAVVVWAVKNANAYFDDQLRELYLSLADKENIRNYKSNRKMVEDGWRYQKREQTHFTLDYRLVLNRWHCFSRESYERYEYPNGLHRDVHNTLDDICTVAKNLGFDVATRSRDLAWAPGEKNVFCFSDGSPFMDVRAFLKGTIHVRVDQGFMRKLNVEASRLFGWVKSAKEAAEETGIGEAEELFGTNFRFTSVPLLASEGGGDGEG